MSRTPTRRSRPTAGLGAALALTLSAMGAGASAVSTAPVAAAAVAAGVAAAAAASGPAARHPAGLRFDRVFTTTGEPPALHYRVTYTARGMAHRLDVWRDGDRRLVRRTDDAVETHVARRPGEANYQMVVLDRRRHIETRVTRDDLYRIGHFSDWFDLAHGLRYPNGDYRLTAVPRAATPAVTTLLPCRWYRLEQGGRSNQICWNAQNRLPIAILNADAQPVWQVESVERRTAPVEVFEVRDQGYVRSDASRDISGD